MRMTSTLASVTQAESRPQVVLAAIAAAAQDLAQLPEGLALDGRLYPHLGPNRRPVRDSPDEPHEDPFVGATVIPVQETRLVGRQRRFEIPAVGDEEVEVAVVVKVGPGASPEVTRIGGGVALQNTGRGDLGAGRA